ncbi:hypothetical protein [Nostoc sp. DSM 114167]|uniref:hypothetical protein n=1 Tax=Nostoc sp. DSM 114167 TaxID=3439050 RepID=UPI0040464584
MTSSWAASHPSVSETGTRDDPNDTNAASPKEKKIASREQLLPFYSTGSPFLPI